MAHQLYNYNGLCKNIHGHSYLLYVTVGGHVMRANSDPNDGMVMDFSELKKIVNENIINEFDRSKDASSTIKIRPTLPRMPNMVCKCGILAGTTN